MGHSVEYHKIKILLEETGAAFDILSASGGHPNDDFAGFASSMSLQSFRHILQNPDLGRTQLAAMLRYAEMDRQKSGYYRRKSDWSKFLARYVESHVNTNFIAN